MSAGVVQLGDMAHVLRFKASSELTVVSFGCWADPNQKAFASALAQTQKLLGESAKSACGIIDVDEVEQDLATPFKLKAIPTTIFFRNQKETARVENCDVEALRKTMAAHMPLSPADLEAQVIKKYAEGDASEMVRADSGVEFKVMSAHFGDINSGALRDVTDKVRELLLADKKGAILADKKELGIEDFANTEHNVLRVTVIREAGGNKVFTIKEGKALSLSCKSCFNDQKVHAGDDKVGYSDGRPSSVAMADADEGRAFEGVSGASNPYEGLPERIPCGG